MSAAAPGAIFPPRARGANRGGQAAETAMRNFKQAVFALAALALAGLAVGCSQSGPAEDTGAVEEPIGAPAPQGPTDGAEPAPAEPSPSEPRTEDAAGEAPAPPPQSVETDLPTLAAPSEPRQTPPREANPPPSANGHSGAAPDVATRGGAGGLSRVTTAVLVELGPNDIRRSRNGGSAVVLLSRAAADAERNLRLCRALFAQIDQASVAEVIAGERVRGGRVQELRPLYWLLARALPNASGDRCPDRIAAYDAGRAERIRTKYGLSGGRGPYLVVAATDEARVAVVDLGAAPIAETENLVRYFKEGFSQDADVWSPARHEPATAQARIAAFLGRSIAGAALSSLITPIARAGCPLGDPLDLCEAR